MPSANVYEQGLTQDSHSNDDMPGSFVRSCQTHIDGQRRDDEGSQSSDVDEENEEDWSPRRKNSHWFAPYGRLTMSLSDMNSSSSKLEEHMRQIVNNRKQKRSRSSRR